jgi:hypothetical protein
MVRVAAATANEGEYYFYSAVTDGVYGYFGTGTSPGIVVKFRLADMVRVAAATAISGEEYFYSAVTDGVYGYFGTNTLPGIVVKFRLSDMARVASVTTNGGENYFYSAIMHGVYGYFATYSSPGIVVKFRLVDSISLTTSPGLSSTRARTVERFGGLTGSATGGLSSSSAVSEAIMSSETLLATTSTSAIVSSMSGTLKNELPDPPPPRRLLQEASIGVSGALGSLIGSTGVATTTMRAGASLRLLKCQHIAPTDTFDGNLFDWGFGPAEGYYMRGALYGALLILACCLAALAVAALAMRCADPVRAPSLSVVMPRLAFPGVLAVPYGLVCTTLMGSSVALLGLHPTGAGDIAVGVLGALLSLAAAGLITAMVTVFFEADWVLKLPARRHENGALGQLQEWARRPGRWCSRHPGGFSAMFGQVFDAYRGGRQWFAAVDVWCALVCGCIQAIAFFPGRCSGALIAIGALQMLYFLAVACFRPAGARVEDALQLLTAAAGGAFGVMVVLPWCDACVQAAEVFSVIQLWMTMVQSVGVLAVTVLRMRDAKSNGEEDGAVGILGKVSAMCIDIEWGRCCRSHSDCDDFAPNGFGDPSTLRCCDDAGTSLISSSPGAFEMEMQGVRRLLDAVDSAPVLLLAMILQICCKRRHENGLPVVMAMGRTSPRLPVMTARLSKVPTDINVR